jgi:hypothetical protein
MTQYINKDALVAELKKRIDDYWSDSENTMGIYPYALEEVIKYTDTLEVKEADLDKELNEYFEGWRTNYYSETEELLKNNGCTVDIDDVKEIARHFYELGLNVNNDTVIEKACNWLKDNVIYPHPRTGEAKCVINLNAFRNAMKGE